MVRTSRPTGHVWLRGVKGRGEIGDEIGDVLVESIIILRVLDALMHDLDHGEQLIGGVQSDAQPIRLVYDVAQVKAK